MICHLKKKMHWEESSRGYFALSPWDWIVLIDVIGENVYGYYSRY